MRRVLVYLLIGLAGLLLLAIVVVQGLLWSDVPRRIVVEQLEQQLGLAVTIDGVSTGWFGRTRLEGLRLSLPLSDRPMIEVDAVDVDHAALLWLVLTGDLHLQRLEVDRPHVTVRQAETGRWNVEQLAEVVRQRQDQGDEPDGQPPALPHVVVRDARVRIVPYGRPDVTIAPVTVQGDAVSRLRYQFGAESPQLGKVAGHLALGEPWTHEVSFDLRPNARLVASLVGGGPAAKGVVLAASGDYVGQLADGDAQGTLALRRASFGGRWVEGRVAVRSEADAQRLIAAPVNLALHGVGPSPLTVTGGQIVYTPGERLQLEEVALAGWGVDAVASGEGDPRRQSGTVKLAWRDGRRGDDVDHRGSATLTLSRGVTGGRGASLEVEARARSPWGDVDVAVTGQAFGPAWDALRARMTVDRLDLERSGETFVLGGAVARLGLADGRLRLDRLSLPAAQLPRQLAGEGFYDLGTGEWNLEAAAASFALPALPLDRLSIQLVGNADRVELRAGSVRLGGLQISSTGGYVYQDPQPLSLDVTIEQLPIRMGDGAPAGESARGDGSGEPAAMVTADNLGGLLRVRGVVSPLNVRTEGELTARSLRIGGKRLGDVAMRVEGSVDATGARGVAEAPQWLGGQWRAEGAWDRVRGQARVEVAGEGLDLGLAQQLFDSPVDVQGAAGLKVTVDVPQGDSAGFVAAGTFDVNDFATAAPAVRVDADRVEGQFRLDRRTLRLTDIRMTRGESSVEGQVAVPLRRSPMIEASATFSDWPVEIPPAEGMLGVTGEAAASFVPGGALSAQARAAVQVRGRDVDLADLSVDAALAGDRLTIASLKGEALGGAVAGEGVVDLADVVGSDVTVRWRGVEPAMLSPWLAPLVEWEGRVTGSLEARRAADARAIGPLKMVMQIDARQTTVRGLTVGNGSATAYTDGQRFVLENFALQAMGGDLNLWGRVSRHGQEWFAYASASARNLDLAAVTAALAPQRQVLGRFDADLTLSTPLDDWRVAFGRGRLELRESDLANIPLFRALFNLVNLRIGSAQPDGRGRGDLRIEEGYVILNGFRYQNRGTQINLVPLRIADIWAGEASPIAGFATLTQNLLPEVEFFGTVNEALAVLQSDLVAARIDGTLGEPRVRMQALRGVTGELRDIITGGE